jgi:hypothetical protein
MRDHRARSEALLARYQRAPRRVLDVARVNIAVAHGVQANNTLYVHRDMHVSFAVSLTSPRQSVVHRHVNIENPRHLLRGRAAAITLVTQCGTGRAAHTPSTGIRDDLALQRVETRRVDSRTEDRVRAVDRVVPDSAAARSSAPVVEDEWPAPSAPRPRVESMATPAVRTQPTPAELDAITNHVLTTIDHRLIAHNERLGRG